VNPAVRQDKTRPLRRTPILNVVHARTCIVLWRFLRAGFAGVENPLFFKENTRKLFGVQGSSDLQASGH
jgi:NAD(P) transhydrogenase subunit beta